MGPSYTKPLQHQGLVAHPREDIYIPLEDPRPYSTLWTVIVLTKSLSFDTKPDMVNLSYSKVATDLQKVIYGIYGLQVIHKNHNEYI